MCGIHEALSHIGEVPHVNSRVGLVMYETCTAQ